MIAAIPPAIHGSAFHELIIRSLGRRIHRGLDQPRLQERNRKIDGVRDVHESVIGDDDQDG